MFGAREPFDHGGRRRRALSRQDRGQAREGGRQIGVAAPRRDQRGRGDETRDHGFCRGDGLLAPRHQRQQFFGLCRQRRIDVVDHGDGRRARLARRPLHFDDVGTAAGL